MRAPGEIERRTQDRVVKVLTAKLGYDYLGNWLDRADNRNIDEGLAQGYLRDVAGYDEVLISGALLQLTRAAGDTGRSLYDRNRDVYQLLRYGAKVVPEAGRNAETVWFIDWEHPEHNHFAVAEEVSVPGSGTGTHAKRPDLVLYVNGVAIGIIELKRSTVSVAEGIRQNIDSQRREFIEHFFSTVQLVMAGNDTEGLRYGVIGTPERYYLTWKEPSEAANPLDRALGQMLAKDRLLELMHDFLLYDAGVKKVARHHQFFGVKAAQAHVERREGGIIWHAQGTGKSLTMVWLAKWIKEHVTDPRVLLITDRTELDEQIEGVFLGVDEKIHRARSGSDLVTALNSTEDWLLCSLIHKFGGTDADTATDKDVQAFITDLRHVVPAGFRAKGNLFVFVDECHRTQSGLLHDAMKELLPDATFIGFTGTPLLKTDRKSIEVFGPYIHTYRFDEAVRDKVILDLLYEPRDIDQSLSSPERIDAWFEAKTRNLSDLGKAQLKKRWGTLQSLFSSQSRLDKIVGDVLLDFEQRDRLASGRGNALFVCDSIYEACKVYELFAGKGMRGKCAIVTSYRPTPSAIKGEDAGEGDTERLREYAIYRQMLADWFDEPPEVAVTKADEFERQAKELFVKEPGRMQLLIVVDKLLTGFDAPPATYLYLDKPMRDHGLFQAICRVNRLDADDKTYGYVIDYKDLFRELEGAVRDYTSGALDGYDADDIKGLLRNRISVARDDLEAARESVKALCEPVDHPQDAEAFIRYFCPTDVTDEEGRTAKEALRLKLYSAVGALVRAYAAIAPEMDQAGYTEEQVEVIKDEVTRFEGIRSEIKLASGDYVDLKMFEPAMRHLLDTYVRAEDSRQLAAFDDLPLVQLIVQRGADAIGELPEEIREDKEAIGEVIAGNVRRLIIDSNPVNPRYFDRMSTLLDELLDERRRAAVDYEQYLERVIEIAKQVAGGPPAEAYPTVIDTDAKRALYDNLGSDVPTALRVDEAVQSSLQDGWRESPLKTRRVHNAIRRALAGDRGEEPDEAEVVRILSLITSRRDY